MSSARRLGLIAAVVTTVAAGPAHAEDTTFDRALGWIDSLPTRVGALRLAHAPAELTVVARDVVAALADRATALLALVPSPDVPDLTALTTTPVPGAENSGFGWRRHPILRYVKFHAGTDFDADRGTPVYAAGTAVVAFAGVKGGYGKVVFLDHGGGVVTRYAHLSTIDVQEGAAIAAGARLGRVGATGRVTGPHLHFEVRLGDRPVDPNLAMTVARLQRTDPMAARLAAWTLTPEAQAQRVDRHDRARPKPPTGKRPERRNAPRRDRHRV